MSQLWMLASLPPVQRCDILLVWRVGGNGEVTQGRWGERLLSSSLDDPSPYPEQDTGIKVSLLRVTLNSHGKAGLIKFSIETRTGHLEGSSWGGGGWSSPDGPGRGSITCRDNGEQRESLSLRKPLLGLQVGGAMKEKLPGSGFSRTGCGSVDGGPSTRWPCRHTQL